MKDLERRALFPSAGKNQNRNARNQDHNADPLRGIERTEFAAFRIAAEHFDHEPPNCIQNEIPAGGNAEMFFLSEDQHQHHAEQQQKDRFHQRYRQAHCAVRVFHGAGAAVGQDPELRRFPHRDAVAAAGQKTADPPECVRYAEAWRHEIRKRKEVLFLLTRNKNDSENAADQSAVKDHTGRDKLQNAAVPDRVDKFVRRDDPVEQFHADKAKQHRPNDRVDDLAVPVERGLFAQQPA